MRVFCVLVFAASVFAQANHRKENPALLGIVAAPEGSRIVVAHVLKKSPAAKAGLKKGDEILSIDGNKIAKPKDVDAALSGFSGGQKVTVEYRRGETKATANAKLIARGDYRGDFLKRQRRGATKFKAPEWFIYSWAQAGDTPPTLETTKKKVVVIHCFQSW